VIGTHAPSLPFALHASQIPVHVLLQHTPSTQFGAFEGHSADDLHGAPTGSFVRQIPW
jgi:hypothetical protein